MGLSLSRIITFALAVLVLVGLGVYLFLPKSSAAGKQPRHHTSPAPSHSPTPSSSSPSAGAVNIYQWLPFNQAGLTSAATLTTKFAEDYGSYSYRQDTTAYLAPLRPLASGELVQVIGRAFAAPGVASARTSQRQVATATVVIDSLRAFGPTSLTFVVALTQRIATSKGSKQQVTDYTITVTGAGTSWQVSDIELAEAGNL